MNLVVHAPAASFLALGLLTRQLRPIQRLGGWAKVVNACWPQLCKLLLPLELKFLALNSPVSVD